VYVLKKISFVIFVIFITVVSFEFFLRYSPFSSGISPVEYDKDIGMWHKKDFESYLVKECYKNLYNFDTFGRVSNSYKYDKNKKDIVILGDSQIEALMVKNDKIIHNSLHKEFDGKYNVLNYGLSGTGPAQQYQILKNKVDLSNTNTILHFVFLENDLNDGDPKNLTGANRPKVYMKFTDIENYEVIKPKRYDTKEKIRDFLGQFELYAYIQKTYKFYSEVFKSKEHNTSKIFLSDNDAYKWNQLMGAIYQMQKIATRKNITYNIIIFSEDEFLNNDVKNVKKLKFFLNRFTIKELDITPFLQIKAQTSEIGFECDAHWNSTTHEDLAKYITKELF
jgi:hypothetical protein